MPSTSKKQHNFMAAVANSPAFAKKAGVPASVGKDFINADKGRKFKEDAPPKELFALPFLNISPEPPATNIIKSVYCVAALLPNLTI